MRALVLLQLLDDAEEIADLVSRQCGGRLVHDDDARVMRERAGDFDQMLLRHAEQFLSKAPASKSASRRFKQFARHGPSSRTSRRARREQAACAP